MKWKVLIIISVLIFLNSACKTPKRSTDTSRPKPKTEIPKKESKKDTVLTQDTKTDPIEPNYPKTKVEDPKNKGRKDIINVVVVLPMDGSYDVGRFSEFVNGFGLAAESMNTGKPRIKIEIINIGNINTEKEILAKSVFKNVDIIIGGYQTSQVKALAQIALNKKIPYLSIWNTTEGIVESNPYYVQLKPALGSYCAGMAEYVAEQLRPQIALIIVESENSKDAITIDQFQRIYKANNLQSTVIYADENGGDWKNSIAGYSNIVINIPNWEDKAFVNSILNQINSIRKNKSIIVTGMPQWTDWDQMNFNLYENMKVHIPVFNYVDKERMNAAIFTETYFNKYNTWATPDSYYASDVLNITRKISIALSAGKSFNPSDQISGNYFSNYVMSAYQTQPLDGTNRVSSYSHNTFVTIEKFEGGRFVPIQ